MKYADIYFDKSIDDLVYEDIENFFSIERQESETIEFKSFHQQSTFDKNISNIIKGIDAFLNSEGGILIWGAPIGKTVENRKEQVFEGGLSPVNVLKEKDSLVNLISSRITPLPIGIKVKILEKDSLYLYIFEIQQSSYRPHQYNDRYYVRLDGQSKPAPHYLIEALIKRISFPDVNGFIKFETITKKTNRYTLGISVFLANFSKFQNEESASYQLVFFPGIIIAANNYNGEYYSEEYSVLHYGRPVYKNFRIEIDYNELAKFDYKVEFMLSFGGKYSPAKQSSYTLNLKDIKQPIGGNETINHLVSEFEENLLYSDYQERIGKSKDTFIKDIIGRG